MINIKACFARLLAAMLDGIGISLGVMGTLYIIAQFV